jgi:Kef-type K+ transport system membrane component KefB
MAQVAQDPAVAPFLALGVIIAASRIGGTIARHFGQTRVVGELIVGILLGPNVLDLLHPPVLHGVDLHETIRYLAEVGKSPVLPGFFEVLAPMVLAIPPARHSGYSWQPALFIGITLPGTSISISAQVLLKPGVLRTRVGNATLTTALMNAILAIRLISLAVTLSAGGRQRFNAP